MWFSSHLKQVCVLWKWYIYRGESFLFYSLCEDEFSYKHSMEVLLYEGCVVCTTTATVIPALKHRITEAMVSVTNNILAKVLEVMEIRLTTAVWLIWDSYWVPVKFVRNLERFSIRLSTLHEHFNFYDLLQAFTSFWITLYMLLWTHQNGFHYLFWEISFKVGSTQDEGNVSENSVLWKFCLSLMTFDRIVSISFCN